MILTITLNAAVDNALFLPRLQVGDANRVTRVDRDAGGKGVNQSRVIAELGGRTMATGFLGGPEGTFIRQVLDTAGVDHDFVETGDPTRTNFSVEDDSKQPPTTFNLPGPTVTADEWAGLLARCRELGDQAAWVSMAGSLPRGVPADAYRTLAGIFAGRRARVMLDADDEPMRLGLESKPDFIKPNQNEAARLLGWSIASDEDATGAAIELRRFCSEDGFVVLSRGAAGAVLASPAGVWIGRSPDVDVKSTMGSGDSMIGGILWAMEAGKPMEEAFAWGLAAGAATAATDGTKIAGQEAIQTLVPQATVRKVG
ncbi:MAG TPA: 1-phosphofructokinase family hexose kinase [Fimbriimonas sp.]